MSKQWARLRVVVEVPVRGDDFSVRDLRWIVDNLVGGVAINSQAIRYNRKRGHTAFGKVEVKEFERVARTQSVTTDSQKQIATIRRILNRRD